MHANHTKPAARRVFVKRLASGVLGALATPPSVMSIAAASLSAQEKHYLTEEQALKLAFPSASSIVPEDVVLTEAQYTRASLQLRYRLAERRQRVWKGWAGETLLGYAMVLNEIGKEQYITFVVALSPMVKVLRVVLMDFRESRGWEVEDARFTNQFRGKTTQDPLVVGADIQGITGATLSSDALCRGTRKALAVCQALYRA